MPRSRRLLVLLVALVLVIAACGDDDDGGAEDSTATTAQADTTEATEAPTTTAAFDEAAATAEISENLQYFIDTTIDDDEGKLALVQESDLVADLYLQGRGENVGIVAKVDPATVDVTFNEDHTAADVTYGIVIGDPPPPDAQPLAQANTFVLVDGTWMLSLASFCDLMDQGGTPCSEEIVDQSLELLP